jgi:hypothetical protein
MFVYFGALFVIPFVLTNIAFLTLRAQKILMVCCRKPYLMENNKHPALVHLENASHAVLMARSDILLGSGEHEKRMALMTRLARLQDEIDAITKKVAKL